MPDLFRARITQHTISSARLSTGEARSERAGRPPETLVSSECRWPLETDPAGGVMDLELRAGVIQVTPYVITNAATDWISGRYDIGHPYRLQSSSGKVSAQVLAATVHGFRLAHAIWGSRAHGELGNWRSASVAIADAHHISERAWAARVTDLEDLGATKWARASAGADAFPLRWDDDTIEVDVVSEMRLLMLVAEQRVSLKVERLDNDRV